MMVALTESARYQFPMRTFHGQDFLINKAIMAMAQMPAEAPAANHGAGEESGQPGGTIPDGPRDNEEGQQAMNGAGAADEFTTNQNSWTTPPQPTPARASLPASTDASSMNEAGRMAPAVTADGWNRRRSYNMSLSVENRMRLLFNKPLLPSDSP